MELRVVGLVLLVSTLAGAGPALAAPPATVPAPPASADTEARLAKLPPDRQAYERYRYWRSFQPKELDDEASLMAYAAQLVAGGTSKAEAAKVVDTLRRQGKRLEAERWNDILTAEKPRFNVQANAFLVDVVKGRKPGTALDVGMGQGRNALYLARLGWKVTGFDPAERAVAAARDAAAKLGLPLDAVVADDESFDWGKDRWDLIVMSYVGVRNNVERVVRALRPGGLVVVEAFHRDVSRTQSVGGVVVFDTNELLALFGKLRVRRYEDAPGPADFAGRDAPLVRLCAEKP
jgi:SAM-dependent methyltransferase